ncbi:MAG: hypothetical protein ACYC1U_11110 [Candidatus Aquicultorales bacterium]
MSRKQTWQHLPFESKTKSGRFTKIVNDMLESKAWYDLTASEKELYLHMKQKFNGSNARDISFTHEEGERLMAKRTFRKSVKRLIELGFIDLIENWPYSMRPNIYGFSDRWKEYGK